MRVVVTANGKDLSSQVDPRFGRCPYYIFIDPETMEFESVENPNVTAIGGAGIQSAQFIANRGAQVVLTGSCGPNAFQTLSAAGIKVIVGVVGSVADAINRYKQGLLQPAIQPNVPPHFGSGLQPGPGMGPGMGRGMGRGMGPGMGFGPMAPRAGPGMMAQPDPAQELAFLRQQADILSQQIELINRKIKEIEGKLKGK
ncbi:dinitrogenase iron-molybdenum cofactor biosynthesis protein [candidate division WOR-3 bacterium]|uniref:Dinitrogenase iron-molybdenum cofactor biosynthesis protein n=1 Tax=candidate division WOR-3 bacterium TaxID=2052148 RepID=A0A660SFT9_UNCW3|nr:MAG: dinitrogenase iron-molybdenum cofactor biosynthesis protein [candidate division WOR-3 bacterium]